MVSLISTNMHEKSKVQNDLKWIFLPGGDTIFAWWGYNFCPNLELTKEIFI
jgi:hypothetical protein